jgi:hypothetical protein
VKTAQATAVRQMAALIAHQHHADAEGRRVILDDVMHCSCCAERLIDTLVGQVLHELHRQYADVEIDEILRRAAARYAAVEATP